MTHQVRIISASMDDLIKEMKAQQIETIRQAQTPTMINGHVLALPLSHVAFLLSKDRRTVVSKMRQKNLEPIIQNGKECIAVADISKL